MDVDSMEAGRTLDALIAERVMGLVPCQAEAHKDGAMWPCYAQPDSPMEGGELPCYSTDIAAAWQVVETLRVRWETEDPEEPFFWRLESTGDGWRVEILWDHHDGMALPYVLVIAATAPLAICRAALAATGVTEGQSHD